MSLIMLPQLLVIMPNLSGKYLKYKNGFVSNAEADIFNTMCKIAVEMSKTDERYVHLRFCYSNKYWAKEEGGSRLIASSSKLEEDKSKPSCTLFEPFNGTNDRKCSFKHVQSGQILASPSQGQGTDLVCFLTTARSLYQSSFSFVDWDKLVMMPKYVAFKGDNGHYLRATWIQGYRYLQFSSVDASEKDTGHEVTMTPDGHIRLKSDLFGLFWRRSPNWIWADSDDTSYSNKDTLFWPVKLSHNVIALRNAGNDAFCKRLTTEGKTSCLNAGVYNITSHTKLQVEELVYDKQIFNVRFRMEDARIYDETPIIVGAEESVNESTRAKSSQSITVKFEKSKSFSFHNSFSIKLGVETKITTGIPSITEGSIQISTEISTGFEWSKSTTETTSAEASYTTDVPPRSRVVVQYVATQGKCDVPFSYRMKERLSRDGSLVTTEHDDGVFVGINSYNFHFNQPKIQPLPQLPTTSTCMYL